MRHHLIVAAPLTLAALALTGCGSSNSANHAPVSCVKLGGAESEIQSLMHDIDAGTVTDTDAAASMKKIAGKMQSMADATDPGYVRTLAQGAADAAGRIRVGLLGGNDTIAADTSTLLSSVTALDKACAGS